MPGAGTIARAFQIAREGNCQSINDIRRQLEREDYHGVQAHLSGALIQKQLGEILRARPQSEPGANAA